MTNEIYSVQEEDEGRFSKDRVIGDFQFESWHTG